jgi:hypothetical protein
VDGPVGAAGLAELPGAVERVHDPYPARGPPGWVVGTLLGQHHVAGALPGQGRGEELVRQPVARLAQHVRVAVLGAQAEQPLARPFGQVAGEAVIVVHPGSSAW